MCSNQSSTIHVRVTPEDLLKDNEGKASTSIKTRSQFQIFIWTRAVC